MQKFVIAALFAGVVQGLAVSQALATDPPDEVCFGDTILVVHDAVVLKLDPPQPVDLRTTCLFIILPSF